MHALPSATTPPATLAKAVIAVYPPVAERKKWRRGGKEKPPLANYKLLKKLGLRVTRLHEQSPFF